MNKVTKHELKILFDHTRKDKDYEDLHAIFVRPMDGVVEAADGVQICRRTLEATDGDNYKVHRDTCRKALSKAKVGSSIFLLPEGIKVDGELIPNPPVKKGDRLAALTYRLAAFVFPEYPDEHSPVHVSVDPERLKTYATLGKMSKVACIQMIAGPTKYDCILVVVRGMDEWQLGIMPQIF